LIGFGLRHGLVILLTGDVFLGHQCLATDQIGIRLHSFGLGLFQHRLGRFQIPLSGLNTCIGIDHSNLPPGGTCMSIAQNRPLVSFPATVMVEGLKAR